MEKHVINTKLGEDKLIALLSISALRLVAPSANHQIISVISRNAPKKFLERRIDTIVEIAHFFAQCNGNTVGLSRLDENLRFSKPEELMGRWPTRFITPDATRPYLNNPQALGNFVYANWGGNVTNTDGFYYRGSGLFSIRGRAHFRSTGQLIGVGNMLERDPERVRNTAGALDVALAMWTALKIEGLASSSEPKAVADITRRFDPQPPSSVMQARGRDFRAILDVFLRVAPSIGIR
jgi:putative chitinase